MTLVLDISNNYHIKDGDIIDQSICFLPVDFVICSILRTSILDPECKLGQFRISRPLEMLRRSVRRNTQALRTYI